MTHPLASPVLDWYAAHQRDLPWRRPEATPWAVLVSEIMLQQTPVSRVLPVYGEWLARWPRPADLAAAPAGEAVRAWGRLGYPRRAIRLHLTAQALVDRHDGQVPESAGSAPGAARHRRLHRRRGRELRVRAAARGPGHQRAAGAGPGGGRPGTAAAQPLRGRTAAGRVTAAGDTGGGRALVRRGHGTGRAGLHRGPAPVPALPRRRSVRLAPGGPPARRRPAAQPGLRGHRPAVPRAAARGAPRRRTARSPARRSTRPGPSPGNGPGRSTAWSRTAWSTRSRTAGSPCPACTCGTRPTESPPCRKPCP